MFRFVIAFCFAFSFVSCGPHTNKESEEHGAFSPKENKHYKDGQHNSDFDHESILGSRKEADEFDHLPPEESKRRLAALAVKMDTNGDNWVTKEELADWIHTSFQSLNEEDANEEMMESDSDGDGSVTWREHLAETFGLFGADDEPLPEDNQMLESDRELFTSADVNGDGALDLTEYVAFSHPEDHKHMHPVLLRGVLRERDADRDGSLSLEEFLSGLSGDKDTRERRIMEEDRFRSDYDTNGDGKLNSEEVLKWIVPDERQAAVDEADHLVSESDVDGDGRLSVSEIVDQHQLFVGSEATDFGEHLRHLQDEL